MLPLFENTSDEKYNIRWEGVLDVDLPKAFRSLREKEELIDVSLACSIKRGGSISVGAHKVILSAYSPVFEDMFRQMKDRLDPYVYMKDVSHENLINILDFIYNGSVNISKLDIESFLSAAKGLQIRGLNLDNENHNDQALVDQLMENRLIPLKSRRCSQKLEIQEKEELSLRRDQEIGIYNANVTRALTSVNSSYPIYPSKNLKKWKRLRGPSSVDKNSFIKGEIDIPATNNYSESSQEYMDSFVNTKLESTSDNDAPIKVDEQTIATQIDKMFEDIDKQVMYGRKKRPFVRCKICSKEVRKDKRRPHLTMNHSKVDSTIIDEGC